MNPMWKKAVTVAALVATLGLGGACGSSDDPSVNAATNETVKRATTSSTEKSTATTEKESGDDHDDHKTEKSTTTKAAADEHDTHDTAKPTTTDARPRPIIMKSFKYENMSIKAGVETVVDNKDDAPHTLTAKDDSFDTGTINAKEKGKVTVAKAGTYDIYCVIHPSMKAKLKVT